MTIIKKLGFLTYTLATFLIIAALLSVGLAKVNELRINKALSLHRVATQSELPLERQVALIQSDFLAPSEDKKLALIQELSLDSDSRLLEYYLGKLKSESGMIKSASYFYIKGDYERVSRIVKRINNAEALKELADFREIAEGRTKPIKSDSPAQTECYALVKSISGLDFTTLEGNFRQIKVIKAISLDEKSPETTRFLNIAGYLDEIEQPHLALLLLEKFEDKFESTYQTSMKKAEILEMIGENKRAFQAAEKALLLDPSKKDGLRLLVRIARKNNLSQKADYYSDRLRYLENLSR